MSSPFPSKLSKRVSKEMGSSMRSIDSILENLEDGKSRSSSDGATSPDHIYDMKHQWRAVLEQIKECTPDMNQEEVQLSVENCTNVLHRAGVLEGVVKPSKFKKRKKIVKRNLSSHLRRFDSSLDSDSMMLPDPKELEMNSLIVNTDGSISPIQDRTLRLGTDRMGKLILVRQTDSRQCFLTTQARRLSVDKVKKDEKTSLGNQASRFARMLKRKSEELARQKAKETCYNPSVLERAWELRTGDYINIKAEIVQEFGSDVFEDHKNIIKGLLQFLNISELCGAELVQTSSDSRSKRCESIPWFMGSDSSSLDYNTSLSSSSSFITKPQSKDNRFLKPESRMPSVLQRRNSIRRSIWLDHGIVTTHSSSGKGFRNLMSDISWDELESVKGGDQYIMKPLTKSAISSKDDDDTGIQIVQEEEEEEENEIITLGSGFNGSTFLYRSRENNRLFAVKTIDMIGTDNRNQVTRELATLVQRRSSVTMIQKKELSDMRCIVHLFGYHVDEAKINLILEYMNMGGLDRITKKFYKIPERVVAAMAWQIATGLNYLHETKRSIHRDIKPANILWATSGRVKISDFGLASLESEKGSTLLGTRMYISPERYEGTCTFTSDVYALGLILVELLSGHHALVPDHHSMSPAKTEIALRNALKSPTAPSFELKVSKEFRELIKSVLIRDHRKRITSTNLLKSKWFHLHGISSLHDAVRIVRDYIVSSTAGSGGNSTNNNTNSEMSCPVNAMYLLSVMETPRHVETSQSHFLMAPSLSL